MEIDHELRAAQSALVGQQASGRAVAKKIWPGAANLQWFRQRTSGSDRHSTGRVSLMTLSFEISQRLLRSNWSVNAGAFNYRRFP
jgi:hypothetical protein